MAPPAPNSYMQPGAEVTKVSHTESPGGSQARAAATQTDYAAPAGTVKTDPTFNAAAAPVAHATPYPGVNTIATDHDPTQHFSSPGLQARAAAAGQAPAGTAQPAHTLYNTQPAGASPAVSPMGTAPDSVAPSSSPYAADAAPQRVPYTPIDGLNTAREVFQPTSPNQPQPEAMEPPHYQQQPQFQSQSAQQDKPYTFTPQPPQQSFNYTYSPETSTPSSSGLQSSTPSHTSPGGVMARTAATQTADSAPPGTRSAATVNIPGYRAGNTYQTQTAYQPATAPPSQPAQYSPNSASPGMAARAAAIQGAHPAGTGPDAGVVGIQNFAAQRPAPARGADVSQHFSPAGAAARAAAAGEAPAGTGAAYAKQSAAAQPLRYQAPSANINVSPEAQVSPAGMQARALAYGMHPPGTGPGSVPGRSYSTLAGAARRSSAVAAPRVSPAVLRRKGGLVLGAAAAAGILFSS